MTEHAADSRYASATASCNALLEAVARAIFEADEDLNDEQEARLRAAGNAVAADCLAGPRARWDDPKNAPVLDAFRRRAQAAIAAVDALRPGPVDGPVNGNIVPFRDARVVSTGPVENEDGTAPPETHIPFDAMSPEGEVALRAVIRAVSDGLLPGVVLSATVTVRQDSTTTCRLRVADGVPFGAACLAVELTAEALRAEVEQSAACPLHGRSETAMGAANAPAQGGTREEPAHGSCGSLASGSVPPATTVTGAVTPAAQGGTREAPASSCDVSPVTGSVPPAPGAP